MLLGKSIEVLSLMPLLIECPTEDDRSLTGQFV